MIESLVAYCVRHRRIVFFGTLVLAVLAGLSATRLKLDAMPDITSNQVLVLTRGPGLTPEEIERFVTRPVETVLGGVPGMTEQRSLSRYGLSAVTVVFEDDVEPYLARQMVQERINTLSLPPGVEAPEMGPLSGGLGEIFHFTLSSPVHTPAELFELTELRVSPILGSVPGVVEVNTWGGRQRVLEVRADPIKLSRRNLTLGVVRDTLEHSTGAEAGASLPAGAGHALLRAVAWPEDASALGATVVSLADGSSVRLSNVADVREGSRPRIGSATANGRGETVYVMVQMLAGANALEVTGRLHDRMPDVRRVLPEEVRLDVVYDRGILVNKTLVTVGKNLAEGGLLVVVMLFLMLGSLRAGVLVALAIPLSMSGATAAMVFFGVPGNLMSLGAIDFGLLVDGAVVMVESVFHSLSKRDDDADDSSLPFAERVGRACRAVGRPVFFSVLVILLVYVPVLSLGGVDGKMFRPMALTVVFALATALVLSLAFIPAAAALVIRPKDIPSREPWLPRVLARAYRPTLTRVVAHPGAVAAVALVALALGAWGFAGSGLELAPQLDEGDLVVQTTRAPDISDESAVREAGRLERTLLKLPEVKQVVSRIGSPAVATDVMGLEEADVFVELQPHSKWRKGLTRDALIAEMEALLERDAPGSDPAFTQPIQMRFNELLAGAVTDVAISVYGEDHRELRRIADSIVAALDDLPGAADVRVLASPEASLVEVRPRALDTARAGLTPQDVLDAVRSLRVGIDVGATWDGPWRVPIVLRLASGHDAFTLAHQPIPVPGGGLVTLGQVADVAMKPTPSQVSRHDAQRRLIVGFNVRGADLGTVVKAAQARVAGSVKEPRGYRVAWGGQYEALQEAGARLKLVIPAVLLLILFVLVAAFHRLRPAIIIFTHVPFACVGGIATLSVRGMPLSLSAAVGFIALSGIAVLNGVVLMTRLLELEKEGASSSDAAKRAALARFRPVLTTALVAALGFVPMMLATGTGAEVQRPLATVVVGGLFTSTLLTLFILPALYPFLAGRERREAA